MSEYDDQGRYAGGRRPHWDDELIEHVSGVAYGELIRDDEWDSVRGWTYAVIAAVEDWQREHAGTLMMEYASRAYLAEVAIQRVREACNEALNEEPMPDGEVRRGYNLAMKVVLFLLDGER